MPTSRGDRFMFGLLNARADRADRIETLVGPGVRLEGNLSFTGGLRIDGEVRGNLVAAPDQPSVLVIGATGRVEGDIKATCMVVNGVVSGSIHVTGLLELHPGARVSGDLRYGALEVHAGAVLQVELKREVLAAEAPTTATSTPITTPTPTPQPVERVAPGLVPVANAA